MKAHTKNLLHWSSEIYPHWEKKEEKKKRIEFFFFLKQLKVKYKIKTILILMKHISSTVVNNFVIDAKSKVCFKTLR